VAVTFGNAGSATAYQSSAAIGLTTAQAVRATLDAALVSSATDNIGTIDVTVTGTFTATGGNPTAGTAVVTIEYIQRTDSGAQAPTTFQN
jgi:phage baseplate assembly protein gpV